jgi:hypothetical protein
VPDVEAKAREMDCSTLGRIPPWRRLRKVEVRDWRSYNAADWRRWGYETPVSLHILLHLPGWCLMPVVNENWPNLDAARADAARRAGHKLLEDARDRAPTLSGELKDSGVLSELDDGAVRVEFTAPYAVKQHYLDYEHPNGERFYLRNAADEIGPQMEQIVADEVRARLGG